MSAASGSTTAREPPPASASQGRLAAAKTNIAYLALGSKASVAPASLRTRSFLTTTRYVVRYAIRRLLRYAKYAVAGAAIAAIGGGLLGTLGSGLAFFAAPGIGAGMAVGVITAVAKFGWRHRGNHFRGGVFEQFQARANAGHDAAQDEATDAEGVERERKAEMRRRREDVWMRV